MGEMFKGKVKWFNAKKGYGFILGDDGVEVFVHFSDIEGDGYKTLKDGQVVRYCIGQGQKGAQAEHVSVDVD